MCFVGLLVAAVASMASSGKRHGHRVAAQAPAINSLRDVRLPGIGFNTHSPRRKHNAG